jgi:hypothetical protein
MSTKIAAAGMAEQLRKSTMFVPFPGNQARSRIEAAKTVTGCTQSLGGLKVAPHCPAPSGRGDNPANGLHMKRSKSNARAIIAIAHRVTIDPTHSASRKIPKTTYELRKLGSLNRATGASARLSGVWR